MPYRVDTGDWYTVNVLRAGRSAYIIAKSDKNGTHRRESTAEDATSLALSVQRDALYLGDDSSDLMFEVCTRGRITLDDKILPLSSSSREFDIVTDGAGGDTTSSVVLGRCTILSCLNNATTLPGARCQCGVGYTGVRCQTDIDECASQPCNYVVALRCIDKVNGYVCEYRNTTVIADQNISDTVSFILVLVLVVIILMVILFVTQRVYIGRRKRKDKQHAEETVVADPATILIRDTFHDMDGRGNVMDYHDEGGGETDLESIHIGYSELLQEQTKHPPAFVEEYEFDERLDSEALLYQHNNGHVPHTQLRHDDTNDDTVFYTIANRQQEEAFIVEDQTDGGFEIDVDAALDEMTLASMPGEEAVDTAAEVDQYLQQRLDDLGIELTELLVPDEVITFEGEGTEIDDVMASADIKLINSDVDEVQFGNEMEVYQRSFVPSIRNNTFTSQSLVLGNPMAGVEDQQFQERPQRQPLLHSPDRREQAPLARNEYTVTRRDTARDERRQKSRNSFMVDDDAMYV